MNAFDGMILLALVLSAWLCWDGFRRWRKTAGERRVREIRTQRLLDAALDKPDAYRVTTAELIEQVAKNCYHSAVATEFIYLTDGEQLTIPNWDTLSDSERAIWIAAARGHLRR
jgi:hypothetical protein